MKAGQILKSDLFQGGFSLVEVLRIDGAVAECRPLRPRSHWAKSTTVLMKVEVLEQYERVTTAEQLRR